MKLSILLPILAAGENEQLKKKDDNRTVGERFVASEVNEQCLNQVPNLGGTFQASNQGSRGEIRLENYADYTNCKHVVQAEPSCEEIQINYRSVAVESSGGCYYDSFRFGWTGTNGFDVTPPRCDCFGDGCSSVITHGSYEFAFHEANAANIGPDSVTVNANTFTFFFYSDYSRAQGHILLDWECVRYATTTATPTTT